MRDRSVLLADMSPAPSLSRPGRTPGPTNAYLPFDRAAIEQSLPQRFEEVVRRHPDRLAVQSKDQALTYDALNRAANGVAHAILAHGNRADRPIPLLLEKGAAPLVATLGTLKAGRAYVPLDAALPPERLQAALEDSAAGLVVTNGRNAALAAGLAAGRVAVLDMDAAAAGASAENPARPIAPDPVAYIIYTSGSIGRPKGVAHTHRTALHGTLSHTNSFHICADDRLTFLYSFAFSASVKNALAGYCFEGTVAFEMARQFRALGQPVGLLALIEAAREDRSAGLGQAVRRLRRRLAYERDTLAGLTASARAGYALARAMNVGQEGVERVVGRMRDRLRRRREEASYLDRAIRRVEAAHAAASRRYVPQGYPGRIVLFRAARLPARFHGDPCLGWRGLAAGGIEIEEIPGEYRTIVEDAPARRLAQRLGKHLEMAQTARGIP